MMETLSNQILGQLASYEKIEIAPEYHIDSDFRWENYLYKSDRFRRAHVEILDAREVKKIWVMHMTVFPYVDDPNPVFGFDVVAGQNKITGAFHDFSKMGDTPLYYWFQERMKNYKWSKTRELPDWAKEIFSPQMVAASNIQNEEEIEQLCKLSIDNLDSYLYNVGYLSEDDYSDKFNKYCRNQKMNPHTPAMMESLGIDKNLFRKFMDDVLFPEYHG